MAFSFGFTAKEHVALAEKLISNPPKERFDRVIVDKKVTSRERHLKVMGRLIEQVGKLDQQVDEVHPSWQKTANASEKATLFKEFKKLDAKLQKSLPGFFS